MTRTEKILLYIKKDGQGLEIGPSYAPIAPKKRGFRVHIIDHLTREQLVQKYRNEKVDLHSIEDVDYVWRGEPYRDLTGKQKFYDWIIAAHVIEHTPDLIGFLLDCDSILKDDGVLSLAVPDHRYCFDCFRSVTGLSQVIDAHHFKHTTHTPGTAAEATLNYATKNGQTSWSRKLKHGAYQFLGSLSEARIAMDQAAQPHAYHDYHAWCFTPHSFRLLLHDLYDLGHIPFKEISFFPTAGCEFHVTLGRKGQGPGLSRLEMLEKIQSELAGGPTTFDKIRGAIRRTFKL
jgi:hypothetical protein